MKIMALFQSGFLMAVYLTLNLPVTDFPAYQFPDDLGIFQANIYESVTTLVVFAFVLFMLQFYADLPEHEKPAGIIVSMIMGPLAVHLAAHEALWQAMDIGLRMMIIAVAVCMIPILVMKSGWTNAIRFITNTSVFVGAYAIGLYSTQAEYAWVMPLAAVAIITPEIVMGFASSKIRQTV